MTTLNGRHYAPGPNTRVGICIDGCDPAYLEAALPVMPNLQRMMRDGCSGLVQTIIPSFTNPNNVGIVTGVTADLNGIPGNYYYDPVTEVEVMMNDPAFLRTPTILAHMSQQGGRRVAAITTKDKLRTILAEGMKGGICFSVEQAHAATTAENGIDAVLDMVGRDNPGIYDPEASIFCIEAGAALVKRDLADFLYLTTTDFVQHKYAPGTPNADGFYARLDTFLGELHASGAVVGITADHGMNDKVLDDGSPNVRFLEDLLVAEGIGARVILPITDPYVVHHGSLGSAATVYLDRDDDLEAAMRLLRSIPGVEHVLEREQAVDTHSLPPDSIGDLFVLGDQHTVLGRTPAYHDLAAVASGLRSHGGLHEATVPMILNRPLAAAYDDRLRGGEMLNIDLFDALCNGVSPYE